MEKYGFAFKTIRLIKGISLSQAATDLNIDERTLRKIEDGETDVITPRFDQLLNYYSVEYGIVFDLAKEKTLSQNIVRSIKGNDTIVHQNTVSESSLRDKDKLIAILERQIEQLNENLKFQNEIIERLMKERKSE